ncbi:TPA: tail fiber domain-containing protein [Pseudomonas aeruginosa]|uniref:tail fiber domain-containing protein n=1 Tax=Pseudomonas aeruginosa TaxID=287 RepID=UPI000EB039EE|nr:tail fiber domain-containing protein [Pseudomonas aeruginosa]MBV6099740.1 tail fiber domain-containing protein [Pseudomonas aeruginosa]MCK1837260.1 tail fiber domain-containing protein [Pseudomonas aeruginosa]RUC24503.1 tail fiber domain-containing protein [Pseudomonas aeruginosa]RUC62630.1 tail fiber domain-containing protein [Pseudomonas aeruginosa]RUK50328.1 tail fiber domain-containing protein [Pseudomonas aeruginosa]
MGSVKKIVGSITGSTGADAAKDAANAQAAAANNAARLTQQQFDQLRKDLAPFVSLGTGSQNALLQAMGYTPTFKDGQLSGLAVSPKAALQQQFSFTGKDLQNTPGYQFALNQGLRAVQNSASAQGLGLSGAQLKGATQYATGLADQTYGDQYNRALSTYNTNYQTAANNVNNLMQLLNIGQSSAAQTGVAGLNAANTAGGYLTQGANAIASGKIGAANAYGNALQSGIGTGLGLFALMSDRRMKVDIKRVGQTDSGLPIYTYRYKGHPTVHMGVMAQELQAVNPDAVVERDGILFVNYAEVA